MGFWGAVSRYRKRQAILFRDDPRITHREHIRRATITPPGTEEWAVALRSFDVQVTGTSVQIQRSVNSVTLTRDELEQVVRFVEDCQARDEMGQA